MTVLLFDLEATCWEQDYPPRESEIIEYAAIALDEFGEQIATYQSFVRPVEHPYLSAYCIHLTGIEQTRVEDALTFDQFYKDWLAWLEMLDPIQSYIAWGNKDLELWERACSKYRLDPMIDLDYVDMKRAYHELFNIQSKIGLKKALAREGMVFEGDHHRALDDTYNLTRLYKHHIGQWPFL